MSTPTVDKVVKALPITVPTTAIVIKAVGKNQVGFRILKPAQIMVGMTPVDDHKAIIAPINKNKKIGAMPDSRPLINAACEVSQLTPHKRATIIINPIATSKGAIGLSPKLIIPVARMTIIAINSTNDRRPDNLCTINPILHISVI